MLGLRLQYIEFDTTVTAVPALFSADSGVLKREPLLPRYTNGSTFSSFPKQGGRVGGLRVGLSAAFRHLLFSPIRYPRHLSVLVFPNSELFCGSEVQIGLLLDDFSLFMLSFQLSRYY